MKEKIILIGGGGHCKACIDVIEQEGNYQIAGIVDLPEMLHQQVLGYEIFATDIDLPDLVREYRQFFISLGQILSAQKRIDIYNRLKQLGAKLPSIISPTAYVSKYSEVGSGTIVMQQALVNAGARIGHNCIINSKSLIEHDAVIADHCHIATGAVINGGVRVGNGTFVGSLAMIRENLNIGANCIIGAGQAVLRDLEDSNIFRPGE